MLKSNLNMDKSNNREKLIQHLISLGYLKTPKIIKAFRSIPRENFVPVHYKKYAYVDEPLPIGFGQTISAPHMVAIMTELLQPQKTDKVLEVGAGSGYQAALLSKLVKIVYTIEIDKNLVLYARKNIGKMGIKNVKVVCGDGSKGLPKYKPYDKIIVTCGCPEIPEPLIEQLKIKGRIVIPVGSYHQELIVGVKTKTGLKKEMHGGCIFVPLRH